MWVKFQNNPAGRNVGDCSVRAISKALSVDWETAYAWLVGSAFLMADMPSSDAVSGAAVDEYGNVTSRATVDVPRGCCFTVSVEYVSGVVNDPATTPTPLINVIDGSLSINRVA